MNAMSTSNGLRLRREDHELIVTIADAGSVTRAAALLHVTQSAVSHSLKAVEDALGGPLFLRERRRTLLTALGSECVQQSRLALEALRRADAAIGSFVPGRQHVVNVGTECYTSYHWLPQLTRAVSRSRLNYRLNVAIDVTRHVVGPLLSGEIDMAVMSSLTEREDLTYVPLMSDEVVLVVPRHHKLAGRPYVTAEELVSEDLLIYDSVDSSNYFLDQVLRPALVNPRSVHRVALTEAIIYMVAAGWGVTPMSAWMVHRFLKPNRLTAVRIGRRGLATQWRVAFRRDDPRSRDLTKLARVLSIELNRMSRKQRLRTQ